MTYLNYCYPSSMAEMHLVEVWADLWLDNATDHKYLLEDYVSSKWAIGLDPAGVSFEVRACIVVAERYTTPEQRLRAMADSQLWSMKIVDGIVYEVVGGPYYTSVHWESTTSAPMPDVSCPEGCILFDTGSYHEKFVYILRPMVAESEAV